MNVLHLIDKKRHGQAHTREELAFLVDGVMSGGIPDYQLAAWLMAVCWRGLDLDETTWLTDLYVQSGRVLDFSGIDGVVADKHSTGGVGDKTTLVLGPMLAACGLKVAKLSGRGLGFTGGTIDKLEAIPGFKVSLSVPEFMDQVRRVGIALCAQTEDLAPADGKIYALRDVTGTVASIPLIAASVVSKKIAAGAQVITLDIKVGEGAFMKSLEEARALAQTCREVGRRLGRAISTVISSMEQPLGRAIGHTLEVMEAIDTLNNQGPDDLTQLCCTLGGVALVDAGVSPTLETGKSRMHEVLKNGQALDKFCQLVRTQHGNPHVVEDISLMPQPRQKIWVTAPCAGVVHGCDAFKVAQAAKVLGAGRLTKGAPIDLSVGVMLHKKVGDGVEAGEPLAQLWVNDTGIDEAIRLIKDAFYLLDTPAQPLPLVKEMVLSAETVVG